MRTLARALLLSLLSLLAASFSLAQTTGTITGRATDDNGGPLPGASIEARSDALQGTKAAVTQADGFFRLTLLPPGTYSVTATLQGFARVQKVVVVLLDRSATVDFRLSPSATAEVTVTAGAPTIDTTSTTLGNNVTQRSIQSLPTARNYSSVVQTVAGTSTDNANSDQTALTVYGSSGAENGYLIDGINTTNVEYGLQGKELNFEFIQEIDVKTGGYEAEHGRATGGIVNVITRSGGNEYHGDAFGYYTDNGLQASNKNVGATLQGATVGYRREDFGADLGGPILRDRLWFFGAYDWVQNTIDNQLTTGPFEGSIIPTKSTRNLGSAKLTWTVASGHSVVASYIQDPRARHGSDQRRQPHPERGPAHLPRRAAVRRTRLRAALRRHPELSGLAFPTGGAARRAELRRALDDGRRHDRVHRHASRQLPDGRLRPRAAEELCSLFRRQFGDFLRWKPRDQDGTRVGAGHRRRRQEDVGRTAGHDLRQPSERGPTHLPALLLDDPDGDSQPVQRAGLAVERQSRSTRSCRPTLRTAGPFCRS